jgi:hypothetical protein
MTTIKLPLQRLDAIFAASEANRDARTVPMVFYTGAKVLQFSWERGTHYLTLSLDTKAVRLKRLNSGSAPFTLGHASPDNPAAVIGIITNARIEGKRARADVRFSQNHPDAERYFQDVMDGILTNVSVEAALHKLSETTGENEKIRSFVAEDWEPTAVALVSQAADPGAHINASAEHFTDCTIEFAATAAKGDLLMNENDKVTGSNSAGQAAATPTNPDAEAIRRVATVCHLAAFGEDLIGRGVGINEARAQLIDKMAAEGDGGIRHVHAAVTHDGRDGMVDAMAEALACRYTGKAPGDRAREFMGASIPELARVICETKGVRSVGFGAERYVKLAMQSTSDFTELTTGTGNRMLLAAYEAAQAPIKRIARRSSAPDFRTKSMLRLGGAPKLLKVLENGAVTAAGRAEAKESYRIYSFARIFALTREALVNDDLGAFSDFARAYGIAAANLEAQELVDLLYGAAGVGPDMADGDALFHVNHSNLNGAPGVISDTTLTAGRLALRTATDLDGETIIETAPRYLVVPAAIETLAEKYLSTIYPAQASNANPFSGKLELIVEPRLDGKSATGWYLFGSPDAAPVLEYSHLNQASGPEVTSRVGFDVLGLEIRCVLDYGVGAIGWRGCWKGNN